MSTGLLLAFLSALSGHSHPAAAEARGDFAPSASDFPPFGAVLNHHFNAVTSWGVEGTGEVKHVYA